MNDKKCDICDEPIYYGEDFIKNINNEYAHFDCLKHSSFSSIVYWLGHEIQTEGIDLRE